MIVAISIAWMIGKPINKKVIYGLTAKPTVFTMARLIQLLSAKKKNQ